MSTMDWYRDVMNFMIQHSRKHSEVWGDVALESQDHHDPSCRMDEKNYQIWGCDYLVRSRISLHEDATDAQCFC